MAFAHLSPGTTASRQLAGAGGEGVRRAGRQLAQRVIHVRVAGLVRAHGKDQVCTRGKGPARSACVRLVLLHCCRGHIACIEPYALAHPCRSAATPLRACAGPPCAYLAWRRRASGPSTAPPARAPRGPSTDGRHQSPPGRACRSEDGWAGSTARCVDGGDDIRTLLTAQRIYMCTTPRCAARCQQLP